jgi:transposase-like protein
VRFCGHWPGDRWFVDETYVKVNGIWRYVYRASDQHGQVIDVLVCARRDEVAARRFFRRALEIVSNTPAPIAMSHIVSAARTAAGTLLSRRTLPMLPNRAASLPSG